MLKASPIFGVCVGAVSAAMVSFDCNSQQQGYLFLIATEKYEPVHAKWTTERCAICRWVEDWDDNKIIICNRCFHNSLDLNTHFVYFGCLNKNFLAGRGMDFIYKLHCWKEVIWLFFSWVYRCQIAVHQECYGEKSVQDFTSWVCRACESPDLKRDCCLCPVQGMPSRLVY